MRSKPYLALAVLSAVLTAPAMAQNQAQTVQQLLDLDAKAALAGKQAGPGAIALPGQPAPTLGAPVKQPVKAAGSDWSVIGYYGYAGHEKAEIRRQGVVHVVSAGDSLPGMLIVRVRQGCVEAFNTVGYHGSSKRHSTKQSMKHRLKTVCYREPDALATGLSAEAPGALNNAPAQVPGLPAVFPPQLSLPPGAPAGFIPPIPTPGR